MGAVKFKVERVAACIHPVVKTVQLVKVNRLSLATLGSIKTMSVASVGKGLSFWCDFLDVKSSAI